MRIIVPYTAGGFTDQMARMLQIGLQKALGQPIVIENKPGAGSNIGAEFVARSAPDGYTMFVGTSGPLSINISLYRSLRYDPIKDFAPVMLAASAPFVVVVNASSPWKTLGELVEHARKNPGKLNNGIVTGNATHLATELFASSTGIKLVMVPYKGTANIINEMFGGQIDVTFASTPAVLPHIKAGKLRALAVTSRKRLDMLANVPTIGEYGLKDYEASVWYGMAVAAKTPPAIVQRLNTELRAIVNDPKVREALVQNDFTPEESSPEQFAAYIKAETAKWAAVVKSSGATAD